MAILFDEKKKVFTLQTKKQYLADAGWQVRASAVIVLWEEGLGKGS